ncbi:MAG TPA: bifunctional serine/threonine-protein kinase/formylglycine-generating enzyme family protein [Dokdonella sp.]
MTRPPAPFEIPGYRLVRSLGHGGMATVYLAMQESLARPVAIKVLASESAPSDELVRRFEHEARTIARLDHPHIVSIFDVGRTSAGQIYYTMPYLPNGDLSARNLRDDPERVLEIMRAIAEALGCAHDQGIVHRDVKPENILFDKLDRPLLADFGIALSGARGPRVTREGATIGSSGYMSPEQARGQPLDGRSDFYSLGVVCYELLTGEMPFQGADALSVALAHIEKPVPRLPLTRRLWQPLIDKALAKQPEQRFQSAEEMLAAIEVIGRRLRTPPRSGLAKAWQRLIERIVAIPRRTRALALCLLIVAALAGLIALLMREPERAAQPGAAFAAVAPSAVAAPAPQRADAGAERAAATAEPASPPGTDDADAKAALRAERLRRAAERVARRHLVAPDGDAAADLYLAVLADEPRQRDAVRGIQNILAALGASAAVAIAAGDAPGAAEPISRGLALAERAKLGGGAALDALAAPVRSAIDAVRSRSRDPFDASAQAALAPLLPVLARLDAKQAQALQADLERPAELLRAGGRFHDPGGPEMAVVPTLLAASARIDHAFAIATTEVTRAAYARFVAASGRRPAPCRDSQRLFARSDGLDWTHPGFAQADDHPVVCVSWDDANAYARWLGARTGARYRLPSDEEWLLVAQPAGAGTDCGAANIARRSGAGACDDGYTWTAPVGHFAATPLGVYDISGNVGEWIDGCARAGRDDASCRERAFRGLSWRDDASESNLRRRGTSAPDVGYATVGFRLVREVPAPRR